MEELSHLARYYMDLAKTTYIDKNPYEARSAAKRLTEDLFNALFLTLIVTKEVCDFSNVRLHYLLNYGIGAALRFCHVDSTLCRFVASLFDDAALCTDISPNGRMFRKALGCV